MKKSIITFFLIAFSALSLRLNAQPDVVPGGITTTLCADTAKGGMHPIIGIELWKFMPAGAMAIRQTIQIMPGASLTFSGATFPFLKRAEGVQIIVEPGGELIIEDGAILTCCDPNELWEGVMVLGDIGAAQTQLHQGVATVRNGGGISNAYNAFKWPNSPQNGGMIQCTDAVFTNNRRIMSFLEYNYSDLLSYFSNCTITINNQWRQNNDASAEL